MFYVPTSQTRTTNIIHTEKGLYVKFYVGIGEPKKIPEVVQTSIQEHKTDKEKLQMKRICESRNWKSPVCNNRDLYYKLKKISQEVWVNYWLMLWITNAESNIWSNFAPKQECWISNNLAWMKRAKRSDWSNSLKFDEQYKTLDNELKKKLEWCYLYYFETIEDFRYSFGYSLKYWYYDKNCKTPECISKWRVWVNWLVKENWSKRVRYYMVD